MSAGLVRIEPWLPEELLYSVMARTQRECVVLDPREALESLVGSRNAIPSADLPSRLDEIFLRVGGGAGFSSVKDMIDRATLFPYFTAFMPVQRRSAVLDRARNGSGVGLKMQMGLIAHGLGASTELRCCSACAEMYLERHGDVPWLRMHQLPGVIVCAIHGEVLFALPSQSNFSHRHRLRTPILEGARPAVSDADRLRLQRFAASSRDLLAIAGEGLPAPLYSTAYRSALRSEGFARGGSQLNWGRLRNALRDGLAGCRAFPFKDRLGFDSPEMPAWIRSAVTGKSAALHPVCHVLLIEVLFDSLDAFLKACREEEHAEAEARHDVPPAKSLSASAQDQQLLLDEALSCREVARRLQISITTVVLTRRQHRVRISERFKKMTPALVGSVLTELRKGAEVAVVSKTCGVSIPVLYRILKVNAEVDVAWKDARRAATCTMHRQEWLLALKDASHAKVADLRKKAGAAYAWLRRHDSEWLGQNLPGAARAPSKARVDWVSRDAVLASRVPLIAAAIRSEKRPIRVTPHEILRRLSFAATWHHYRARLPLLMLALKSWAEPLPEFKQRQIEWRVTG